MRMKKLVITTLLAAFLAVNITGCGNSGQKDSVETAGTEIGEENPVSQEDGLNQATTIRIGYQPLFGTQIIALEDKFHYIEEEFAKDNIQVEFYTFEKGPALLEAMTAGGIDIGDELGSSPFITTTAAGNPIVGIAAGKYDPNGTMIIVADKESEIESYEDLKGKKVAVAVGTAGHSYLIQVLKSIGLTADDIELVNLAETEYLAALEGDSIDACVTLRSTGNTIVNAGAGEEVSGDVVYASPMVYVANSEFAQANPELVARFLKNVIKYNQYAAENRSEVQQLIADYFDIDYENLDSYQTYNYTDLIMEDYFYNDYQNSVDFLVDQETIEGLDLKAVTDNTYIEEAYRLLEDDE